MQIQLLVLYLCIVVNAISDDTEILQKWNEFQVEYKKNYGSPVEVRKRFEIFKNNVKEIEAHNALFNQGVVSYEKAINKFADLALSEIIKSKTENLKRLPQTLTVYEKLVNFSLPASIDWREKNAVTSVRQEGDCDASYAISTAGAIEGLWALTTGNLVPLSAQNVLDCSWSEGDWGCAGGSRFFSFDYVQENGIESEEDYPFVGLGSTCSENPSKIVTKISDYVLITQKDEDALQQAIVTIGPISAGIDCTLHLVLYNSGIFDDNLCGQISMNHNILIVGFGTENNKDYYIIKNSWGEDWGESGYFRLARNQGNKCGIATLAFYPVL